MTSQTIEPQMLAAGTGSPEASAQVDELDRQGRHEEAVSLLQEAARQGDLPAMTMLGKRLLIGRDAPLQPQEGIALLRRAAESGWAEAQAQMATLTAAGSWTPRDWPAALAYLQQAAENGSARARGQLLLLSADRELACHVLGTHMPPASCWSALCRGIDLEAWRRPPPRVAVCEAPRIRFAENFTTPEVCQWLINQARGKLKPALMFDGKRPVFVATRNNSDFCFDILEADLVVILVRERASALLKLPVFAMEPPQIFHYGLGQEIQPHYDHVGSEGGYPAERIATLLLYLNDDYEGGELEFPKVGFRRKGRAGDAVYFANVDAAGLPDKLSIHAALPVTCGEKWILSQWVQDRTFGSAG